MADTPAATESNASDDGSVNARLARTYAEALIAVADQRNEAEAIQAELDALIDDVFAKDARFEAMLNNKALPREKREQLLAKAFDGKTGTTLYDFLQVVAKNDRLELLRSIRAGYRSIVNDRGNRIAVIVSSVTPLTEEQKHALRTTLGSALGKEPILENRLDPELLGGMVVQVGDEIYDGSIRHRIDTIRTQLLARGSHEIQVGRDRFRSL